jgi:hypothetical protein
VARLYKVSSLVVNARSCPRVRIAAEPGLFTVPEQVESAEVGEGDGRRAHVSSVLGMPDRVEQEGIASS